MRKTNIEKHFLLSCILFSLISCAEQKPYEGKVTVHSVCESSEVETREYDISIGDSFVGVSFNYRTSTILDGFIGYLEGVYTNEKMTKKVKASKLLNFDGSFSDLYLNFVPLEMEAKVGSLFDGEYTNENGEKMVVKNGLFTGTYSGIKIAQIDESIANSGESNCYFYDASINDGDPLRVYGTYTFVDYKKFEKDVPSILTLSMTCSFLQSVYDSVTGDLLFDINESNLSSISYSRPNTFSIDYDL